MSDHLTKLRFHNRSEGRTPLPKWQHLTAALGLAFFCLSFNPSLGLATCPIDSTLKFMETQGNAAVEKLAAEHLAHVGKGVETQRYYKNVLQDTSLEHFSDPHSTKTVETLIDDVKRQMLQDYPPPKKGLTTLQGSIPLPLNCDNFLSALKGGRRDFTLKTTVQYSTAEYALRFEKKIADYLLGAQKAEQMQWFNAINKGFVASEGHAGLKRVGNCVEIKLFGTFGEKRAWGLLSEENGKYNIAFSGAGDHKGAARFLRGC